MLVFDQHHPPSDSDRPGNVVRAGSGGGSNRAMRIRGPGQGSRVGKPNAPAATLQAKASRIGAGASHVLEWPWDRPSTTIQRDERLAPPGHHDLDWATRSLPEAVVLSEKAATILQGFPETWVFTGKTKVARWSQIGQAMPPPLAHAVATSVVAQMQSTGVDPTAPRAAPVTHVVFERGRAHEPREQLALPDPPPPEPRGKPRRRRNL